MPTPATNLAGKRGWVIARTDWFGPTIYWAGGDEDSWDESWVFGADRHRAIVFSDLAKADTQLPGASEWRPVSDLETERSGERAK